MQQTLIVEIYKKFTMDHQTWFSFQFRTLDSWSTDTAGTAEVRSWMTGCTSQEAGWKTCSWLNSKREGHLLKQDMLLYCRYRHIAVFTSRLYDIISYHIKSYHIISYHIIMSYHIISNHSMQCHIVCLTYVHNTFAFLQPKKAHQSFL